MTRPLAGLATALGNIAPLFLMCDPRDLGVSSELRCVTTDRPTIFLYDRVPSGVGSAEKLFELHERLLQATAQLIRDCPCSGGCPACVGPEGMIGEGGKQHAIALLESRLDGGAG